MASYLRYLGGRDTEDFAHRKYNTIFEDSIAAAVNFQGRKNKAALGPSLLYGLIRDWKKEGHSYSELEAAFTLHLRRSSKIAEKRLRRNPFMHTVADENVAPSTLTPRPAM